MIVVLASVFFLYRLCSLVEPTGTDGFFYLKQIQTLSENFQFYYHDYSLSFVFPSLINVVLRNPFISFNIACAVVWGGIAWFCVEPLKGWRNQIVSLVLVIILSTNTLSVELGAVFYKTGFALLLSFMMWHMLKKKNWPMAIIFGFASLLSHKTMIVFLPILIAPTLFTKISRKQLLLTLGLALLGSLALLAYPRFLSQLNHVLQEGHFWEKFLTHNFPKQNLLAFIVLMFIAGITNLYFKLKDGWVLTIILILPFFSPGLLNTEGVAFRFMVMSFPFFILFLSLGVQSSGWRKIVSLSFIVMTCVLTWNYYRPLSTWSQLYTARVLYAEKVDALLPPNALIFAPHGVEFYLAYKTKFRPRSLRIEPKDRPVYRVAYVRPYKRKNGSLFQQDLEQMQLLDMGEFSLISEADWLSLNSIHSFIPHPMNLLPKKPDFVSEYED